jgi:hypothetical protein
LAEFRVDIDALSQLSFQLASIHDALTSAKSDFGGAEATLGSDPVAHALGAFSSGWKDGRNKIEGETASLSSAMAGVAADYADGERVIQGSFTNGAGAVGGGHGVR